MMSKIISAACAAGYWSGIAGRTQRDDNVARILVLHGTAQRDAARLERELAYVVRWFEPVSLSELLSRFSDGARLARVVAITFDDGLRNNVTVAYPILRRLGVPATFFVCPGLIDTGKWLWTHHMRRRLHHGGAPLRDSLGRGYGKERNDEQFLVWMKSLDRASRQAVEQAVCAATPSYRPSPEEHHEFDLAGWDELRRLDPALVTIGSHTMTHPILPGLSEEECEFELRESRRRIEQELQRPADLLAYPNGDHSPSVLALAARHYRGAVTSARRTRPGTRRLHSAAHQRARWRAAPGARAASDQE